MTQKTKFDLQNFLPYLLSQAADASSCGFRQYYKDNYGMLRTEWRVVFHLGCYGKMTAKEIGEFILLFESILKAIVIKNCVNAVEGALCATPTLFSVNKKSIQKNIDLQNMLFNNTLIDFQAKVCKKWHLHSMSKKNVNSYQSLFILFCIFLIKKDTNYCFFNIHKWS